MIARQPACDLEQLSQLMCDTLGAEQQSKLTRHLDQCNYCRQHLDELADDDSWYVDAQLTLRDLQLDPSTAISHDESCQAASDGAPGLAQQNASAVALEQRTHWVMNMLHPCDDPRMLGQLDGLPVEAVIGQGGMGVVLKARDGELQRCLAVKLLSPMLAGTGAARQRFLREARAAAAVVHPNIVPIYAVSPERSLPYLVMPFVGGGNLQQLLDQQGPLPLERSLSIGLQVAEGLAAAHLQGIVHRDIKPANLLLDEGGFRVMITDFGLARALDDATLTGSGLLAGTPQYMSPEQARGAELDHRSDLYSLGAVLYALATGRPPLRGNSTLELLRRVGAEPPKSIVAINAAYPVWYDRLVRQLMHPQVERRVQTGEQAAQLLRAALAHARAPLQSSLPVELREASSIPYTKTMGVSVGMLLIVLAILYTAMPVSQPRSAANSTSQRTASSAALSSPPSSTDDGTTQTPAFTSVEPWSSSEVEQLLLENTQELDKLRRELSGSVQTLQTPEPSLSPNP